MIENFSEIKVESPADKIIRQIRQLITSGQIKPGDKLPPERKLAEKFGVSRTHVRDAIRKLEFYGIVKTMPQSGTIVSGLGISALEGLITDVLAIEEADFRSLVETRVLLEVDSAKKAAERRTADDIITLTKALNAYENKIAQGLVAVEEDLLFHLKIAEVSKNKVLISLMLIITPDIIKSYVNLQVCNDDKTPKTIKEHRIILQHIKDQNVAGAEQAMKDHLKDVLEFSINKVD
jgi:GntR family transcriptional repressor for pyruvate dehydrogenase complex